MPGDLSYGGSPYGDAIIQRLLGLRNAGVSSGPNGQMPFMDPLQGLIGGAMSSKSPSTGQDPSQNISGDIMQQFSQDTSPGGNLQSISPNIGPSGPGQVNPMGPATLPPAPSLIKSPTGNYRQPSSPPASMGSMPNIGMDISTSGAPSTGPDRSGVIANRLAGVMNAKRGK